MTREEAIKYLEQHKYANTCGQKSLEESNEAIDMAIEALSAEQVTSKLKNPCDSLLTDNNDDSKKHKNKLDGDLISRADAIEAIIAQRAKAELSEYNFALGLAEDAIRHLPSAEAVHKPDYSYEADMVKRLRQAEAVPQSEQYKKGFEDAKRAFLVEYARESENMRKRNAQLEVMLNAYKAISAEAVQMKQTDTLIIADALRYLAQDEERHLSDRTRADALREQILKYGASMCHSAEAVQGWIPCSERLPDVDVEVITTTDWSDVLIAWLRKGGAWETDEYILDHDEIIAWMPLPKPYKGGEDK